jgi:lipopolysaccharide export system protein LptC
MASGSPPGGAREPGPRPRPDGGLLAHRRRLVRPVNRQYSRFVVLLKVLLPTLALGLVALLAAWPTLTEAPRLRLSVDKGRLEMVNARFFSIDEHGQPYSLTAARTDQSPGAPGIVDLANPQAEMTEEQGTWVTIHAERGWYNQDTGILKMRGRVYVLRDDGSEFTTDEAYTHVQKGTAWGDSRVVGQGPQGEIVADGFRMSDRGRTMVFVNSSNANLSGMALRPARPPVAAQVEAQVEAPVTVPEPVTPAPVATAPPPAPTPAPPLSAPVFAPPLIVDRPAVTLPEVRIVRPPGPKPAPPAHAGPGRADGDSTGSTGSTGNTRKTAAKAPAGRTPDNGHGQETTP